MRRGNFKTHSKKKKKEINIIMPDRYSTTYICHQLPILMHITDNLSSENENTLGHQQLFNQGLKLDCVSSKPANALRKLLCSHLVFIEKPAE